MVSVAICIVFAVGIAAGATKTGAAMAEAMQRFLTFYSGVFALVGLTAAVAAGLAATDRLIMSPENRILAQAVHRALAFVAVAFLVTHIVTEILAGRSQVADSAVPFLATGRTFYIGLGTIASDLMVLIAATGIARRRFAGKLRPVTWRVLHGTAYICWPLSIVHGLVAGRPPKPYVSWSYGACMIAVGLALVIRSVATVRPREATSQAWPDDAATPLHTAASTLAAYLLHSQASAAASVPAGAAAGLAAPPPEAPEVPVLAEPATPAHGARVLQWPGWAAQRPGTAGQPATPAGGIPSTLGHVPPAHTPAQGFAGPTHPGGAGAVYTPPAWAANQTPAGGMPVPPRLAAVPYEVEALHPVPPGEEPHGWATER